MAQYKSGFVSITNGTNVVTGSGTTWLDSGIEPGDLFKVSGFEVIYEVSGVESNTKLYINTDWQAGDVQSQPYVITTEFTPNYNFPEIHLGDRDWPSILTKSLRKIDSLVYQINTEGVQLPDGILYSSDIATLDEIDAGTAEDKIVSVYGLDHALSQIETSSGSYTDSDAVSAINADPEHGSSASHNYFSGNYNDLTDKPNLFSGSYNDLTDKPVLFSGDYRDLSNKPTLFSGDYDDLTNKPTLFSGSYLDLTDKPTNFSPADHNHDDSYYTQTQVDDKIANAGGSVDFATLQDIEQGTSQSKATTPQGVHDYVVNYVQDINDSGFSIDYASEMDIDAGTSETKVINPAGLDYAISKINQFSGDYADLTNKPDLFSGSYADLKDKPVLFSESYNDLTDKPDLFSGDYNDLSNKPNIPQLVGKTALSEGTDLSSAVHPQGVHDYINEKLSNTSFFIDDNSTSINKGWSSQKISDELANLSSDSSGDVSFDPVLLSIDDYFEENQESTYYLSRSTDLPVVSLAKRKPGENIVNYDWDATTGERFDAYDYSPDTSITPSSATGNGTFSLGSGSFTEDMVGMIIAGNGGEAILTGTDGSYELSKEFNDTNTIDSANWSMTGLVFDEDGISISKFGASFNMSNFSYETILLDQFGQYGDDFSPVLLDNDNIFLAYKEYNGDSNFLAFIIIDKSGNTVVDETIFFTGNYREITARKLSNGKILIYYTPYDSPSSNYFAIYDQDGNEVLSPTNIYDKDAKKYSIHELSNGNIAFAFHGVDDSDTDKGIFTIYDQQGSCIVDNIIFCNARILHPAMIELPDGNILIGYCNTDDATKGYFVIYDSEDKSISSPVLFRDAEAQYISVFNLSDNQVGFISGQHSQRAFLTIYDLENDTAVKEEDFGYDEEYIKAAYLIDNEKILMIDASGRLLIGDLEGNLLCNPTILNNGLTGFHYYSENMILTATKENPRSYNYALLSFVNLENFFKINEISINNPPSPHVISQETLSNQKATKLLNNTVAITHKMHDGTEYIGTLVYYDPVGNQEINSVVFAKDISGAAHTTLLNGNIFIAYQYYGDNAYFVVYDSDGDIVINETQFDTDASDIKVKTLYNGNVVIGYINSSDDGYLKCFDQDGDLVSEDSFFSSNPGEFAMGVLFDNSVVFSCKHPDNNDYGYYIIHDPIRDRHLLYPEIFFDASSVSNQSAILELPNGNIFIAFQPGTSGSFVIYDREGNEVKAKTDFNTGTTDDVVAKVLPDGRVIIIFTDKSNTWKPTYVIYDQDGTQLVGKTVFGTDYQLVRTDLTLMENGNLLIIFQDNSNDNHTSCTFFDFALSNGSCVMNKYLVAYTNISGQINTETWSQFNSLLINEEANGQIINYTISNDNHITWSIINNDMGVRPIVRKNGDIWEYNSATEYGEVTWTSATTNEKCEALSEAMSLQVNRMDAAQAEAVQSTNFLSLNNTLDIAVILYTDSQKDIPSFQNIEVGYSGSTEYEAAIPGQDYVWNFSSEDTLKIKALSQGVLKGKVM